MSRPKKTTTKKFITSALLDLMKEQPFETISITAITTRAQVARATFYRNFADKEDVIRQYLLRFFYYMDELAFESDTYNWFDFFFLYAHHKKWFFILLSEIHLSHLVLDELMIYWKETHPETHAQIPYLTEYRIYGFFGFYSAWVEGGMTTSPEEMSRAYGNILSLSHPTTAEHPIDMVQL